MSNLFKDFTFKPHKDVPFRDVEIMDKLRQMSEKDYLALNETRPNWKVQIMPDEDAWWWYTLDMFRVIYESDVYDRKTVLLLGNPDAQYKYVAMLMNMCNVSGRNLIIFTMDEWADDDGNIAPISYPAGFTNAFFRFFYEPIREDLRPKMENIHFPTNKSINDYSKMLQDSGEADFVTSACGWSGHSAFVDPVPQFGVNGNEIVSVEEWLQMGARISDMHILSLAQNSLHSSFGMAGDVGMCPPKCATIGPRDIVNANYINECHCFTVGATDVSWQKYISRASVFGPVTPLIPNSCVQLAKNVNCVITSTIASPIVYDTERQYK